MPQSSLTPKSFRTLVLQWYCEHGRHSLPWRGDFEPYHVFLSEIMLQQTQVPRVVQKFNLFLDKYLSFESLAEAPQSDILRLWKGLGYNRRALYLHRSAQAVAEQHGGRLPDDEAALLALPGIGPASANAMLAYAFNKPVVYLETNIRACLIHHFFPGKEGVSDKDLLPIARQCLEDVEPRHWYSALMDYGTWLKGVVGNPSRRSRQHTSQSRFEGSDRQLRGRILNELLRSEADYQQLSRVIPGEEHRLQRIIDDLVREDFVAEEHQRYRLK